MFILNYILIKHYLCVVFNKTLLKLSDGNSLFKYLKWQYIRLSKVWRNFKRLSFTSHLPIEQSLIDPVLLPPDYPIKPTHSATSAKLPLILAHLSSHFVAFQTQFSSAAFRKLLLRFSAQQQIFAVVEVIVVRVARENTSLVMLETQAPRNRFIPLKRCKTAEKGRRISIF